MKSLLRTTAMSAVLLGAMTTAAFAAVSAEEASKLKSTLTPVGAEKAASADGVIPAWSGGMTGSVADYYKNGRRADPFAGEKPLYSVSASNMNQYADRLSEGAKAMLAKYPDSFRLDVYATHRSSAMPQWYYDNTFRNATATTIAEEGGENIPTGFHGGVPFPIPQNGFEAIWNHLTRWNGVRHQEQIDGVLITAEGKRVVTTSAVNSFWYPTIDPDRDKSEDRYLMFRTVASGPPIRAGEALVVNSHLARANDKAWVYLTGQRRVRMLPNACCDTPSPASAGVTAFDEYYVFANTPTRFDWKVVGKKELIVPYNSNMTMVPDKIETILSEHHMNPDYIRWEVHRVWVIEATLREGQRHVFPRGTYYLDEDTWMGVLAERYDSKNTLSRMMWTLPAAMPDVPGTIGTINGFYDFLSGAWYAANLPNRYNVQWNFDVQLADVDFTPTALAADGVR